MDLHAPAPLKRSVEPKYRQTWTVAGRVLSAPIEANVRPYVDALGEQGAVRFLLAFGGAPLYLPERPKAGSRLVEMFGPERAKALARQLGGAGHVRVPVAQRFIARALRAEKVSIYEIARQVRCTDTTVRKFLRDRQAVESEAA